MVGRVQEGSASSPLEVALQCETMELLLVRHAKALPRHRWDGRDVDRPLSDRGLRQAAELARRYASRPVAAVFSSPSLRCVDTVVPLAETCGLTVKEEPLLGDLAAADPPRDVLSDADSALDWLGGRGLRFCRQAAAAQAGEVVVACSHGDLIPVTLDLLFAQDGLDVADSGNQKGSVWTLRFHGTRCIDAHYEPAP